MGLHVTVAAVYQRGLAIHTTRIPSTGQPRPYPCFTPLAVAAFRPMSDSERSSSTALSNSSSRPPGPETVAFIIQGQFSIQYQVVLLTMQHGASRAPRISWNT